MGLIRYLPRSIAHPLVKHIKEISGLNSMRERRLRDRKVMSRALEEMEKTFNDLENQVRENVKLTSQVQELEVQLTKEVQKRAETEKNLAKLSSLAKKLKSAQNEHASMILRGQLPYLAKNEPEVLDGLDINEGLRGMNTQLRDIAETQFKRNDDLTKRLFKYEMRALRQNNPEFSKAPILVYDGKEIHYISDKITRRLGKGIYTLVQELSGDKELQEAISNGRQEVKPFDKYDLVFIPYSTSEDNQKVSAAYLVPKGRGNRTAKVFKKVGERAIRLFRKNIKSIPISTRGLEWNLAK